MQLLSLLAVGGLATTAVAKSSRAAALERKGIQAKPRYGFPGHSAPIVKRDAATIIPQTNRTAKYVVNGTAGAIPEVNFDIGESYAGLLPISSAANETGELYFWFFPSSNPSAADEITIWLNGGPGCSSLEGFLQENGPISWQYGTPRPVYNPWNWANLTNMVWVEQPVGTGFSQGIPTATSQEESAAQFLGFWKNFVDTFELKGRKVYVAGESYAGRYVPYIADAMLDQKNTTEGYFDVKGIMIYDPSIAEDVILEDTIQNMTFGGLQGFQSVPSADFYVPYHNEFSYESLSASGIMGVTHTERKLTWVAQALSGHMVPQYQPSSGYRQLEFLLGRVESLESRKPFSTQLGVGQPGGEEGGNGTVGGRGV
ncbi:alpha/beta-hydrolase [Massarina eburnea CBS 473.64]|uniref:Carboxypeptidase n=1 Tax=Massarina eburnea CBS 473.64 TaxID=1395130 RepID=A0A6A6RKR2_9PLEO|nr:alpha/beta-hydrolase [Massarina eburnea CBS 473.64]